jgi:phosphatidylserine/phosphatidylglycerophosphate/cardiolipin synthase-like enzyme
LILSNHNSWRVEQANRAAVLIDAACYFGALRKALLKARLTVFVVGWDIDSRTRLVGESGRADDGYPEVFIDFLSALVNERPQLRVYLLVWDYSVLFALERELLPSIWLRWRMPRRIRYCFDDDLPVGAAHHQKIVVVDDAIAFGMRILREWAFLGLAVARLARVGQAVIIWLPTITSPTADEHEENPKFENHAEEGATALRRCAWLDARQKRQ